MMNDKGVKKTPSVAFGDGSIKWGASVFPGSLSEMASEAVTNRVSAKPAKAIIDAFNSFF